MSAEVRYYPVGNGDCSLITTPSGQTILVDCRIINDDPPFNVRRDLIQQIATWRGMPYLSSFILTHADKDHCHQFDEVFHTGPVSTWEEPDENELPKIIIGTMWFSPHIFEDDELSSDAEAYRNEALRRLRLHRLGDKRKDWRGNRIAVIGYSSDPSIESLPDEVKYKAGDLVTNIDAREQSDFRLFIHAPFRKTLDNEAVERNNTSIAFMAGFDAGGVRNASKFFFGGDANYVILEEILKQTHWHGNPKWLEYDVWLSTHHCSWSAFNETPYRDNPEPSEAVIELLNHGRDGARIIASSKPVRQDDDDPPHYAAKQEYTQIVGDDRFHCTMEHPDEASPKPLVFDIESQGPSVERISASAAPISGLGRQSSQREYGKHE